MPIELFYNDRAQPQQSTNRYRLRCYAQPVQEPILASGHSEHQPANCPARAGTKSRPAVCRHARGRDRRAARELRNEQFEPYSRLEAGLPIQYLPPQSRQQSTSWVKKTAKRPWGWFSSPTASHTGAVAIRCAGAASCGPDGSRGRFVLRRDPRWHQAQSQPGWSAMRGDKPSLPHTPPGRECGSRR